jgi:putative glycosyltransferase
MKISAVSTLYNSSPYIADFCARITTQLRKLTPDYEIVLVDDGSPDDSLRTALAERDKDPRIKIVELSRNFGHHKAMMTGLEHASGDLIFLIDVDLEEPPELLGTFYESFRAGDDVDVVYGYQRGRKGGLLERFGGMLVWWFLNLFLPIRIPHNHSTVRLMTRDYVQGLIRHKEAKTAIGGLWVLAGFRQRGVEFEKGFRGKTSYSLGKRLYVLLDSITSFSELPLFLVFYVGCVMLAISAVIGGYLLFRKFTGHILEGWTSIVFSIWVCGGLAIFSIGVVGLYVSRIFIETKARPYTLIRKVYDSERAMAANEIRRREA